MRIASTITPPGPRAVDPVCGMVVDPATAKHRFSYRGNVLCSALPVAGPNSRPIPNIVCAEAGQGGSVQGRGRACVARRLRLQSRRVGRKPRRRAIDPSAA
ncbi:MAG: hypothetical protein R3D69_06410 [Xanthobacteraceae bacterium]